MSEEKIELFKECVKEGEGEQCIQPVGMCPKYINPNSREYTNQDDFVEIWERTKKDLNLDTQAVTGKEYFLVDYIDETKVDAKLKGQEYFTTKCGTISVDYEKRDLYCYSLMCNACETMQGGPAVVYRAGFKPRVVGDEEPVFDFSGKNLTSKNWVPEKEDPLHSSVIQQKFPDGDTLMFALGGLVHRDN